MSDRRDFLKFMGTMAVASSASSCISTNIRSSKLLKSLEPTNMDDVVLAEGLKYKKLVSWGDPLNASGDKFGFNNDFISLHKLDENHSIMWVNHESVNPKFVSDYLDGHGDKKTKDQIAIEKKNVGGSSFVISRPVRGKEWKLVKDHPINNRLTGQTLIPFSPKQTIRGSYNAVGTIANCAGGKTNWGTFLTCEENYYNFYGDVSFRENQRQFKSSLSKPLSWEAHNLLPPEHYGWVVEYNPVTKEAKKLIALGRFCHECATTVEASDGRTVVYMADDAIDQHVYKFISKNKGSLVEGQLFVANTETGEWLELSYEKNKQLQKQFQSQQEVLVRARDAAQALGATPLARPEDIEIHPLTGEVFVALTNNKKRGDYHGSILKITEEKNNCLSLNFKAEVFMAGGESSGFSCPDNMVFDKKGNLWITTDISGSALNKGPYSAFKNNGLYYIPLSGDNAGQVIQMASAPNQAEFTGPCFSDDYRTLFLSVQHPGEKTEKLDQLTSHWNSTEPNGLPRPAVIMISGQKLDELMA